MTAGELTERVTFYRPTKTTDALRGQAVAYTEVVATVWGAWRGLTTRETMLAQAMDVVPQYRLAIRYRDDITIQMRVQRGTCGPVCDIASMTDATGKREWLEMELVTAV